MSSNSEEEYQFPDDITSMESSGSDDYSAATHKQDEVPVHEDLDPVAPSSDEQADEAKATNSSPGALAKLKTHFQGLSPSSQRGLVVMGVFFVLVLTLVVTSFLHASSSKPHAVKKTKPAKPVSVHHVVASYDASSNASVAMPSVAIAASKKEDAQHVKQMKSLQVSVGALSDQLRASLAAQKIMSEQLTAMHESSDASVHNSSDLKRKVNKMDAKLRVFNADLKSHGKKKSKIASSFKYYHLDSVVPGRAWVDDQYGDVYTVEVGDFLKDFGRVARIDSDEGSVVSETGSLIAYDHKVAMGD
jgi:type II secretory pathway component PulM